MVRAKNFLLTLLASGLFLGQPLTTAAQDTTGIEVEEPADTMDMDVDTTDVELELPPQATSTQSEDLQVLTLFEAIEYAREHSILARMEEYALLTERWTYRTYRADLLPSLSLSGNAPNFSSQFREVQQSDGDIVQVYTQQSNAQANLAVSQDIALTGGTIGVQTGLQRLGIFEGENNYYWNSTPVSISYRQPINAYNSLKWQQRIRPLELEIAEKEYVEAIESLSQTVTNQYIQVLVAKTNLEISEQNVVRNDSIYNRSQGRFTIGRIAEDELLQAEVELRESELSLNQNRLNYEQLLRQFRLTLGMDMDAPVDVVAPSEIPDIQVDPDLALEMALMNNSESLGYELATLNAESGLEQAIKQSAFSPTITASFGLNQQSEDFSQLYVDPLNRQGLNVSFNLPIFNWGRQRAIINQQRNSYQRTADQIAYNRQTFILSVQSAVNEFQQLPYQLEIAELTYQSAQERYEVAYGRYTIGSQTLTELQNAQQSLENARLNYVRAIGNYWAAVYELRELTLYDFEEGRLINHELEAGPGY